MTVILLLSKDRDNWNGVYLGLICAMKAVPEIVCFIPFTSNALYTGCGHGC